MATSFAAYASQFLNKQQNGSSSLSSSQPMFFSFTTDDGSRAGNDLDTDVDDIHDPHLRGSEASRMSYRDQGHHLGDEDDDPYLRLDEDGPAGGPSKHGSRYDAESVPFISHSSESPKGWLAHQPSPLRPSRSPSPSPASDSSDSSPPADFLVAIPPRSQPPPHQPPPPPQTRPSVSLSLALTESLLPRDGHVRPKDVFSLPDPRHTPRGRRKYNDSIWTALWLTGVSLCLVSSFLILFLARGPSPPSRHTPYTTLLHTVPLLTILTFVSAFVAYTHIFLLRIFVRPVMIVTSVFIPATLLVSAVWAFVGSFMWDANQEPTWGETIGLRIFSLIPLALSIFTARRLVNLPREIHTASSTLTLTTQLLLANPFLLALSPAILLVVLIFSIPFLTLIFRLLLIGYFPHLGSEEWRVRAWADWAIGGTVVVWLWSWGVARGILRVSCSGVIGAWYFADPDALPPPPTSTHTIHSAFTRATSPSLGTIALSALILTAIRLLTYVTLFLRRIPFYLTFRPVVALVTMSVGMLEGATTSLSRYALVYTGLTGDAFFVSARRAKALTDASAAAKHGRKFKNEPPLTLLTFAPLTLSFPFALATYLFVAHTLNSPDEALGAAVLAGGVTALVGMFCVGLVEDTADTLYMCYCIDIDTGDRRREEVFSAFEYQRRPNPSANSGRHSASSGARGAGQRQQPQPRTVGTEPPQPPHPREQLKPGPVHLEDEDVDPFEGRYVNDDDSPISAVHLAPHQGRRQMSRGVEASDVGGIGTTSAELNKKEPLPYAVDSESEGDGEEDLPFPGSGFF